MDQIDITKIPRFQFQINNDQLKNCIRDLNTKSALQEKALQKNKKQIQLRPLEGTISDSFLLITSGIQIDIELLRQLGNKKNIEETDSVLKNSANKLGYKIGQVSDVLKLLYDKMKHLQRRLQLSQTESKVMIGDRCNSLQSQFQELKKTQGKQNRTFSENIEIGIHTYEEKLKAVETKTLWQINDCKTRLNDRVNQQFVRDICKESETRIMTRMKQSLIKGNIDPVKIDQLQIRCLRLQKQLQIKMVESKARLNELKQNIEGSLATRKELHQDKFQSEKKIGNLQVQCAELRRKFTSNQMEQKDGKQNIKNIKTLQQESVKQINRITKMISNLKISDDFQKLMEKIDPHKICEIDTTLVELQERDLKLQKELDSIKRYVQKMRQKSQICNLLAPSQKGGSFDKQQITRIVNQILGGNASIKKISSIQGQLYEFKAYGDTINEINKRISRMQKDSDIQNVIYGLKGLEEYMKKELLIMNTKLNQFQSSLNEQKRKRPISARKTSDGKLSSSVSFKKLVPVDCISCFQNPIGQRTPQRQFLSKKY